MLCPYAEVKELLTLPGVYELEINGCVAVFPVTHICGQDGQSGLWVLTPGSDALQCIHGK